MNEFINDLKQLKQQAFIDNIDLLVNQIKLQAEQMAKAGFDKLVLFPEQRSQDVVRRFVAADPHLVVSAIREEYDLSEKQCYPVYNRMGDELKCIEINWGHDNAE